LPIATAAAWCGRGVIAPAAPTAEQRRAVELALTGAPTSGSGRKGASGAGSLVHEHAVLGDPAGGVGGGDAAHRERDIEDDAHRRRR
jgi:hypothetical protein